jgi:hypothetical protein
VIVVVVVVVVVVVIKVVLIGSSKNRIHSEAAHSEAAIHFYFLKREKRNIFYRLFVSNLLTVHRRMKELSPEYILVVQGIEQSKSFLLQHPVKDIVPGALSSSAGHNLFTSRDFQSMVDVISKLDAGYDFNPRFDDPMLTVVLLDEIGNVKALNEFVEAICRAVNSGLLSCGIVLQLFYLQKLTPSQANILHASIVHQTLSKELLAFCMTNADDRRRKNLSNLIIKKRSLACFLSSAK